MLGHVILVGDTLAYAVGSKLVTVTVSGASDFAIEVMTAATEAHNEHRDVIADTSVYVICEYGYGV